MKINKWRQEHAANEIENCSWMQVFFWWLEFEKINYFIFLCKKLVFECGHSGGNEMHYFSLIKYENGRFQFICMKASGSSGAGCEFWTNDDVWEELVLIKLICFFLNSDKSERVNWKSGSFQHDVWRSNYARKVNQINPAENGDFTFLIPFHSEWLIWTAIIVELGGWTTWRNSLPSALKQFPCAGWSWIFNWIFAPTYFLWGDHSQAGDHGSSSL